MILALLRDLFTGLSALGTRSGTARSSVRRSRKRRLAAEQLENRSLLTVTPFAELNGGFITYGYSIAGDSPNGVYVDRYWSNSTQIGDFPILFDNPQEYDLEEPENLTPGKHIVATESAYGPKKGPTYSEFGERDAAYYIIIANGNRITVPIPYVPVVDNDPDDQIGTEAIFMGNLKSTQIRKGSIGNVFDVDMYAFWGEANRSFSIDIDTTTAGDRRLNSYIRLFDNAGKELAKNDWSISPNETNSGDDAYLTYTVPVTGRYYVGVSNNRNRSYDPKRGNVDRDDFAIDNLPRTLKTETGAYTLTLKDTDEDDQFFEAPDPQDYGYERRPLQVIETHEETLDGFDVDIFPVDVIAHQRVAFDLDVEGSSKRASLRLFDEKGRLVEPNSDAQAPREWSWERTDPYREHTFVNAGRYYAVVAAAWNTEYDPRTGEGDNGAVFVDYVLEITPVHYMLSSLGDTNQAYGFIGMPNHESHLEQTVATLQRVNENGWGGANIQRGITTWIVIHGRVDSAESFRRLAGAIDGYQSGDQVLLLDWRGGAADNPLVLDGAEWTPYVAQWVAEVMKQLDVSGSQCVLVGHSWGSYLAYEIGKEMKKVQAIVALDPARAAIGYKYKAVDYGKFSNLSWAFFGGGTYGAAFLAETADEAFTTEYKGFVVSWKTKHRAPVELFHQLVIGARLNPVDTRSEQFSLGRLITASGNPHWTADVYKDSSWSEKDRTIFEGIFVANKSNDAWRILSLKFRYSATGKEMEI